MRDCSGKFIFKLGGEVDISRDVRTTPVASPAIFISDSPHFIDVRRTSCLGMWQDGLPKSCWHSQHTFWQRTVLVPRNFYILSCFVFSPLWIIISCARPLLRLDFTLYTLRPCPIVQFRVTHQNTNILPCWVSVLGEVCECSGIVNKPDVVNKTYADKHINLCVKQTAVSNMNIEATCRRKSRWACNLPDCNMVATEVALCLVCVVFLRQRNCSRVCL